MFRLKSRIVAPLLSLFLLPGCAQGAKPTPESEVPETQAERGAYTVDKVTLGMSPDSARRALAGRRKVLDRDPGDAALSGCLAYKMRETEAVGLKVSLLFQAERVARIRVEADLHGKEEDRRLCESTYQTLKTIVQVLHGAPRYNSNAVMNNTRIAAMKAEVLSLARESNEADLKQIEKKIARLLEDFKDPRSSPYLRRTSVYASIRGTLRENQLTWTKIMTGLDRELAEVVK